MGGRAGDEAEAVIALDMAVLNCQLPTAAGSQFRRGELRVASALAYSPELPERLRRGAHVRVAACPVFRIPPSFLSA